MQNNLYLLIIFLVPLISSVCLCDDFTPPQCGFSCNPGYRPLCLNGEYYECVWGGQPIAPDFPTKDSFCAVLDRKNFEECEKRIYLLYPNSLGHVAVFLRNVSLPSDYCSLSEKNISQPSNYSLPDSLTNETPAGASSANNRIDLLYNQQNILTYRYYNGKTWSAPESLEKNIIGSPSMISRSYGTLDAVVLNKDYKIMIKQYRSGKWGTYSLVPSKDLNTPISSPSIVSTDENRLDIFTIDNKGNLRQIWRKGSNWGKWVNLGSSGVGKQLSRVSVTSPRPGVIALAIMDIDNNFQYKIFSGKKWSPWHLIATSLKYPPTIISVEGKISYYYQHQNGSLIEFCEYCTGAAIEETNEKILEEVPEQESIFHKSESFNIQSHNDKLEL